MSLFCSKPQMASQYPLVKVICPLLFSLQPDLPLFLYFSLSPCDGWVTFTWHRGSSCYSSDTSILFHLRAFLLSISWNARPSNLCVNYSLRSDLCSTVTPLERPSLTSITFSFFKKTYFSFYYIYYLTSLSVISVYITSLEWSFMKTWSSSCLPLSFQCLGNHVWHRIDRLSTNIVKN